MSTSTDLSAALWMCKDAWEKTGCNECEDEARWDPRRCRRAAGDSVRVLAPPPLLKNPPCRAHCRQPCCAFSSGSGPVCIVVLRATVILEEAAGFCWQRNPPTHTARSMIDGNTCYNTPRGTMGRLERRRSPGPAGLGRTAGVARKARGYGLYRKADARRGGFLRRTGCRCGVHVPTWGAEKRWRLNRRG